MHLEGVLVELALHHSGEGRLIKVLIIGVEGNGVANEVNGVASDAVLLEELPHGHRLQVAATVGLGVLGVVVRHVGEELRSGALLKESHQSGLESLGLSGGHLVDLATLLDEGVVDQHKLHVVTLHNGGTEDAD